LLFSYLSLDMSVGSLSAAQCRLLSRNDSALLQIIPNDWYCSGRNNMWMRDVHNVPWAAWPAQSLQVTASALTSRKRLLWPSGQRASTGVHPGVIGAGTSWPYSEHVPDMSNTESPARIASLYGAACGKSHPVQAAVGNLHSSRSHASK